MESKKNTQNKFNSQFLNRPFSSGGEREIKEQIIQEEIEDIPEHNMTNYGPKISGDFSQSSIHQQNSNNVSSISLSSTHGKKRKPFDKLSFHSDAQTKNESMISDNGISESIMNKTTTTITNEEKSMILASYKLLSKETLDKAKLFNNQYKSSTPFWISFFEDIENDKLKSNSSYYKVKNKSEYVKSLIEMVQRDADLYDQMNINKKTKENTQNSIKQLIIENQKEKSLNQSTDSNSTAKGASENNNNAKKDDEVEEKLTKVLTAYDKLEEKNKKIFSNEPNYDDFKFNLLTGGKFTNDDKAKKEKDLIAMQKMREEEQKAKEQAKPQKEAGIREYKTIDTLYFGDDYTYEDLNYDKIDFCVYEKESIKKLLELDRKLHALDPERYNTSINTELKKLQDDFNAGKKERMIKVEKETRERFLKEINEKDTKKSIFDVKPKDEKKVKYKDYLKENAERKKKKKDLENELKALDNKIKNIYNTEVPKERKEEIFKKLEDYHHTEEYQKKFNEMKVPGKVQLEQLEDDIGNFEKNNKELLKGIDELLAIVKEREAEEEKEGAKIEEIAEEEKEHEESKLEESKGTEEINTDKL